MGETTAWRELAAVTPIVNKGLNPVSVRRDLNFNLPTEFNMETGDGRQIEMWNEAERCEE